MLREVLPLIAEAGARGGGLGVVSYVLFVCLGGSSGGGLFYSLSICLGVGRGGKM